ncbi:MAG: DUF1566 domain-containing protein, partial [Dissulfurispiraceae bacterium]
MKRKRGLFVFILPVLLFFCFASLSYAVSLPQTGQKQCYDGSGNVISCTGTGQDGNTQSGVAWPSPRFTDNSNGTITDNLTGLIWLKNVNCLGDQTWTGALTSSNNLASGACGLSDGSKAGDWRLPDILELESLENEGYNEQTCGSLPCNFNSEWLNSQGFTNAQDVFYWSSSTYANDTSDAWGAIMSDGILSYSGKSSSYSSYVWPVRGGQSSAPAAVWKTGQTTTYATGDDGNLEKGVAWPSPRFTDNSNGTITDNLTGLIWLKNANCFGTQT